MKIEKTNTTYIKVKELITIHIYCALWNHTPPSLWLNFKDLIDDIIVKLEKWKATERYILKKGVLKSKQNKTLASKNNI